MTEGTVLINEDTVLPTLFLLYPKKHHYEVFFSSAGMLGGKTRTRHIWNVQETFDMNAFRELFLLRLLMCVIKERDHSCLASFPVKDVNKSDEFRLLVNVLASVESSPK